MRDVMYLFKTILSSPDGFIGSALVFSYVLMAIAAPLIAPYDPLIMHPQDRFYPPSGRYLGGTDQFGRDILSRLIYGARASLCVAVVSVGLAAISGGFLGAVFGYLGGKLDILLMRLIDILISFPPLILALSIVAFLGASIHNVIVALAVTYFPVFVRMARGTAISLKQKEFVQAAQAIGAGHSWIVLHHIMPNVLPTLLAQATLAFSWAILTEAALSFLGLGVQPPTPSWGAMLGEGGQFMLIAPWIAIFPGLAIATIVIGINLLGDRIRDVLDPRLRGRR